LESAIEVWTKCSKSTIRQVVFKEQYSILHSLKKVDEELFRLLKGIEEVPAEIHQIDQKIAQAKKDFEASKLAIQDCEKKLRAAESELKDKEDKLSKAESKMMEVKTNEEYKAATKENEAQKALLGTLEEKTIILMTELDEHKKRIKSFETDFKKTEVALLEQKQKLESEKLALEKFYDTEKNKRTDLANALIPEVRTVYQKVITATKGLAIAEAFKGSCRGCNMKIRPQLFNEILGFKGIHRCPSCGKLLIATAQEDTSSSLQE
jgi:predicted  nucleic acid-binding Zn-ribbon protein